MLKGGKSLKDSQEYFDDDDDVMLDEAKEEEKAPEVHSLSSNPLIKSASEKIPYLIDQLIIQPEAKLESTVGY